MLKTNFFLLLLLLLSLKAGNTFASSKHITSVSDAGSARATAYTMSSKIIRTGMLTHVTYLGIKEKVYVKTLNHRTGVWSSPVFIGQSVDNHGAPTMAVDSRGHLHIVYGPHHGAFKYRMSTKPNDSSTWTQESLFGNQGTYASVVIDSKDTIHVVYGGGGHGSYHRDLMYQSKEIYSSAQASTWTKPIALVEGGSFSVSYDSSIRLGSDQSLNIGYLFFDHTGSSGGRRIGFMKSTDAGKTWQKMNGEAYSLPVTYHTTEVIEDSPTAELRLSNVSLDSKGNAYMAINRMKTPTKSTSIIRLTTKGVIQQLDLLKFLENGQEYDAYASTTMDSRNRLWIAAPVIKKGDSWGGKSTRIKILRVEKNGSVKEITTLSAPSTKPEAYWLPVFEHFNGHNRMTSYPRLLFTQGFGNSSNGLGTSMPTSVLFKSRW